MYQTLRSVGLRPTAAEPGSIMTFNRPYLLMLSDSKTSEPLMMAWVANPASK
jgi:hypothetical protein